MFYRMISLYSDFLHRVSITYDYLFIVILSMTLASILNSAYTCNNQQLAIAENLKLVLTIL